MEKKKKKKKVSAQQNQIEMEEARAMNAVLNVIKDRGFLLEFPRMRPAARRLILALDKATGQHDMVPSPCPQEFEVGSWEPLSTTALRSLFNPRSGPEGRDHSSPRTTEDGECVQGSRAPPKKDASKEELS